ncbi:type II secretion system secretin GspD [Desulfurivibrio dismutans]|uniref:type II secretion system secretin GspD n=1 Tax=Desulfurivibrio dismutans TaxID=1398908 RepID=UPI0023D97FB0|nr:type II secretion system secretin GspD [Desulfurivibrio alkaliphilus]MDF1613753.1 type II secretion system secretin GspD [Desulfurivibrio alkaliphilus]
MVSSEVFSTRRRLRRPLRLMLLLAGILLCGLLLLPRPGLSETITLNFKEADIESVINSVARITGKTFIVDPAVRGKITIVSSQPLRADEVYGVFLSILQVHDYAAVETGSVVKIIPAAKAGQDLVITADTDQPLELDEDRIVTRIYRLQYLQADRLVPILRPMLNTRSGQMSALAIKEGNALIITERAGTVERLLRIVRRLDQSSGGEMEIVRLEHADARDVVSVIREMELGTGRLSAEQLRLVADNRTNSVLLQGDPHHLLRIKATILHLDTPLAKGGDTQVIFLRHAKAEDLVPILTGMGSYDGSREERRAQQRQEVDIQADANTNALIMTGSPAVLQNLQTVIRQLDIRRAQLMIEAVIAEVSTAKAVDLGIQWFSADADKVIGGTNFPGSGASMSGIAAGDEGSIAALAGLGGFNMGVFSGSTEIMGREFFNFGALVNALARDGDTNILSTPSLVTMDNQEAEIIVGQNVPFLTGSFTEGATGVGGSPFQTVERRDVGIKLRVKPQVTEGDVIRLQIEQEVSSVERDDLAAGLVTNTRNINTSVLVEDGKVLVLGGLISDDVQETVSKVPLLGDIPLLGALFRHTRSERSKRNLMVFLRPVILRDQDMSSRISQGQYDMLREQQLERDRKGVKLMPGQDQPVLLEFEAFEDQHFHPAPEAPEAGEDAGAAPVEPVPLESLEPVE